MVEIQGYHSLQVEGLKHPAVGLMDQDTVLALVAVQNFEVHSLVVEEEAP